MPRSNSVALSYISNLEKNFSDKEYYCADEMAQGTDVNKKPNKSPIYFNILQKNIDSPNLLTDAQRDSIIDYLQFLER